MSKFMEKLMEGMKDDKGLFQGDKGSSRVADVQNRFEEKHVNDSDMSIERIRNFRNIDSGEDVSIKGSYTDFFKEKPQHLNSFFRNKSGNFRDDFKEIMRTSFGLDPNDSMDTNSNYRDFWNRYVDAPRKAEMAGQKMIHSLDRTLSGKFDDNNVRDLVSTVGNYTKDETTKNKFLQGIVEQEGGMREYNNLVKSGELPDVGYDKTFKGVGGSTPSFITDDRIEKAGY